MKRQAVMVDRLREQPVSFLKVNGISVAYKKIGTGRPLIFIHGNGEEHSIFYETAVMLAPYFTCYLLDSRGHGRSSGIEEYHYQDMADDVSAFLEQCDLQDVSICGFSDGGIVGLLLAIQNPRITNLVACGANINPPGVKLPVLVSIRLGYAIKQDPKLALMIREPDITEEELQQITAKTLIVAGEKDLIRYGHTRKIADAIPGSRLRIVRGEGHGSYIVHSRKLGHLLLKWFEKDIREETKDE